MQKFNNELEKPALLVLGNGMVFAKNQAFEDYFDQHDIVCHNVFDFLQYDIFPLDSFTFNKEQIH